MYYFLVNPSARSGGGMAEWNKIQRYLQERNVDYKAYFSKRPGHIRELMYDICSSHTSEEARINIIVLGGDGTLNEAMQGVIDFDKVNIGYLPTGSSNDFARAMGYYGSSLENLTRILECVNPIKMDIGQLRLIEVSNELPRITSGQQKSTYYFNVSCGMGFDAAVCESVLGSKAKTILNKIGLGKLVYLTIALRNIFSAKLCDVTLTLDNAEKIVIKKCRFIAGMNTQYEGGGFMFAPGAVPTDGCLDICTVGSMSAPEVLMALPTAFKGKHTKFKKIHLYHNVKNYEIDSVNPLWIHIDGEVPAKAKKIKVSVIPGGVNFLW